MDDWGYFSFNLYFDLANNQWVCVQYLNPQDDPSYFNVADGNVGASYGYSGPVPADSS